MFSLQAIMCHFNVNHSRYAKKRDGREQNKLLMWCLFSLMLTDDAIFGTNCIVLWAIFAATNNGDKQRVLNEYLAEYLNTQKFETKMSQTFERLKKPTEYFIRLLCCCHKALKPNEWAKVGIGDGEKTHTKYWFKYKNCTTIKQVKKRTAFPIFEK